MGTEGVQLEVMVTDVSLLEPDRAADDVGRESISVIAGRLDPHRPTLPLVGST